MNTTICVIDIETTGLNHDFHEIIQWAVLPLNRDFTVNKSIPPFKVQIRAQFPERADKKAMEVNKLNLREGLPSFDDAKVAFERWREQYNIGQIEPLCQKAFFDLGFLRQHYNFEQFEAIFHTGKIRDTKVSVQAENDMWQRMFNKNFFESTSLKRLAEHFNIDYSGAHDALRDCEITAEVYRKSI